MTDTSKKTQVDRSRRNLLKMVGRGMIAAMMAPTIPLIFQNKGYAAGPGMSSKKVLVAYFSRTGNTQEMAGYISEIAGGDIVRIETVNPYPAEYRATTRQAKEELNSGYKPPLKTKISNLESYDVIFIGSPCWWGTISTPVISFLSEYDFSGKTLVPFMTHLGSGLGRTMSHVAELCPGARIEQGKAIWGNEIDSSSSRDAVAEWVGALNMA